MTFTAPDYLLVRNFLISMEKMVAFEVLKARYAVPAGATVDGLFHIKLHVGAADTDIANEPTTDLNPFIR